MRAVVTRPGDGRAWLADIPEPRLCQPDDVIVQMLRVGICGTDRHVMSFPMRINRPLPDGEDFLVLGHEAVGRVLMVGDGVSALRVGDLVAPTVRRGCDQCPACLADQADLCFSGKYRERGIVGLHGFLCERIVDAERNLVRVPEELAHVGPLIESLCTPEKALRRIGNARAHLPLDGPLYGVRRGLVTGSGPIALLAMMAMRLRNIETVLLARQQPGGAATRLAESAGATHAWLGDVDLEEPEVRLGTFDAIIEATGSMELSVSMIRALARNGVLDLVGGASGGAAVPIGPAALGGMLGRNLTVLGSVNANMADWLAAVRDLGEMRRAFPGAVESLITHEYTMGDVEVAFERVPGQIKAMVKIDLA